MATERINVGEIRRIGAQLYRVLQRVPGIGSEGRWAYVVGRIREDGTAVPEETRTRGSLLRFPKVGEGNEE